MVGEWRGSCRGPCGDQTSAVRGGPTKAVVHQRRHHAAINKHGRLKATSIRPTGGHRSSPHLVDAPLNHAAMFVIITVGLACRRAPHAGSHVLTSPPDDPPRCRLVDDWAALWDGPIFRLLQSAAKRGMLAG